MQNLNKQLREGVFSGVYLLYGEEEYLIRYYRDKLVQAILGESPDGNINYHYFEGSAATENAIMAQSQLMPFFSDSMLILVENSGLFKRSNDLASAFQEMPESTKIIFVEQNIDKRNALYKYVKANGTISELQYRKDTELVGWVASYLKQSDCLITGRAAKLLISKAGVDMQQLTNELEKLIAYVGDSKKIDIEQVEAVCTTQLANRIFVMMDNIVSGRSKEALLLYKDLLALKESPLAIMSLLTRHYNILMQIKEMSNETDANIAKALSVPSFAVRKYKAQAGVYNKRQIKSIVYECIDTEEAIKEGRIAPQIGIELLIIKFSNIASKQV